MCGWPVQRTSDATSMLRKGASSSRLSTTLIATTRPVAFSVARQTVAEPPPYLYATVAAASTVEMHQELNAAPAHEPDAEPPLVYATVVADSSFEMHELNAAPGPAHEPDAEPPLVYATVVAGSTVES